MKNRIKNGIIFLLSLIILILSIYFGKSWLSQHQDAAVELGHQRQYQELSDQEGKEDAARMEEAFKNLDKTR